jgi:hypothetical protein
MACFVLSLWWLPDHMSVAMQHFGHFLTVGFLRLCGRELATFDFRTYQSRSPNMKDRVKETGSTLGRLLVPR